MSDSEQEDAVGPVLPPGFQRVERDSNSDNNNNNDNKNENKDNNNNNNTNTNNTNKRKVYGPSIEDLKRPVVFDEPVDGEGEGEEADDEGKEEGS